MNSSEDVNYSPFHSKAFQVKNKNLEPEGETSVPSMKEFHIFQREIKCLSTFVQNFSLTFFQTIKALVDIKNVLQELVGVVHESPEVVSINTT
jgi:hypothetical protein